MDGGRSAGDYVPPALWLSRLREGSIVGVAGCDGEDPCATIIDRQSKQIRDMQRQMAEMRAMLIDMRSKREFGAAPEGGADCSGSQSLSFCRKFAKTSRSSEAKAFL
jgi:hypothetical protein